MNDPDAAELARIDHMVWKDGRAHGLSRALVALEARAKSYPSGAGTYREAANVVRELLEALVDR